LSDISRQPPVRFCHTLITALRHDTQSVLLACKGLQAVYFSSAAQRQRTIAGIPVSESPEGNPLRSGLILQNRVGHAYRTTAFILITFLPTEHVEALTGWLRPGVRSVLLMGICFVLASELWNESRSLSESSSKILLSQTILNFNDQILL
jgi:hypothetical protein